MVRGIYIELDTLIDTTMNHLEIVSPEIFKRMTTGDVWIDRLTNKFEGISVNVWKEIFKNRDIATLERLRPTTIKDVFSDLTVKKSTVYALEKGEVLSSNNVDVNIYPYEISEQNLEIIHRYILKDCSPDVKIHFISDDVRHNKGMAENYDIMFMLNGLDWLKGEFKRGGKIGMSEVMLFTPFTHDLLGSGKSFDMEAANAITKLLKGAVDIIYTDLWKFSYITEEQKKKLL